MSIIHVSLDVAGMYYQREDIHMPSNCSIKEVMMEARRLDLADPNTTRPIFDFSGSLGAGRREFLNEIKIIHRTPAKSRQIAEPRREYAAGTYVGKDSSGTLSPDSKRFVSYNPDNRFIFSWQYYVYDSNFVDKNRLLKGSLERKVIPYSQKPSENGQTLADGDTIVWRLVTIFIRPLLDDASGLQASVS